MIVRVTDEFNTVWSFEASSDSEVLKIVKSWLKTRDETPIYEILIEIDPE